ncbi:hypothetical protein AB395_00002991 [Sinorhizobium fredii CCBAU 45436]|nr:hypothetical protein AB395_00002991 [Sinorhizobium fredii CCBAU 45436]
MAVNMHIETKTGDPIMFEALAVILFAFAAAWLLRDIYLV